MGSIFKSFLGTSLVMLVFAAGPVSAGAAGLTESQIQAIVSLVSSFGADTTAVANVEASLRGQPIVNAPHSGTVDGSNVSACILLTFNLYVDQTDGQTNGEVTKLQQFLAQNTSIYPEGRVTGYFGPATERAVQRWQAGNGVVSSGDADTTGYGFVGPNTRAALGKGCANTSTGIVSNNKDQPSISVTPPSGPVPLTVQITLAGLNQGKSKGPYALSFGDNTSVDYTTNVVGKDQVTHVYTQAGTYIINLTERETWPPVASATVSVKTANSNIPTVTVVSPNGGETYTAGSGMLTITWSVFGFVGVPAGATVWTGLDSSDGVHSFTFPADNSCTSVHDGLNSCTGSLAITPGYQLLPGTYKAHVRLLGAPPGNGKDGPLLAEDTSNGYFTLTNAAPAVTVTYPQAGYSLYNGLGKGDGTPATNPIATITWTSSGLGNDTIGIALFYASGAQNGQLVKYLAQNIPNSGSYVWQYDSTLPSGTYLIDVYDYQAGINMGNTTGSSGPFQVVSATASAPTITVTYPNGGEQLENSGSKSSGLIGTIAWTSTGTGSLPIEIDLMNTAGYIFHNIVQNLPNTGNYPWKYDSTIPNGSYKVLVSTQDKGPTAQDYSDGYFTLSGNTGATTPPWVTITANPNTITSGQSTVISWNSGNATSCTSPDSSLPFVTATSGSVTIVPQKTMTIYTVACSGSGGSASASATVTVTAPAAPTISYITPTSAAPGATVYLIGSNFDSATFIGLDGIYGTAIQPSAITVISPTSLSFVVPSSLSVGAHTVAVAEKAGPWGLSNSVTLNVIATPH